MPDIGPMFGDMGYCLPDLALRTRQQIGNPRGYSSWTSECWRLATFRYIPRGRPTDSMTKLGNTAKSGLVSHKYKGWFRLTLHFVTS